jgi:Rrf2 family protein
VKFLELLLLDVKGHGLLESKTGRGGGYRLTRPPSEVNMGSLMRMMEGSLAPILCARETAYEPCETCTDVAACAVTILMRHVRDAISDVLDKTTLADVLQKADEAK